jgi:hypothetical protein
MSQASWFPEFRDSKVDTKYPFSDTASLTASDGLLLDRNLILDASLYPRGAPARLSITSAVVTLSSITLNIGAPGALNLASTTFNAKASVSELTVVDSQGRPAGLLIVDPGVLVSTQTWPPGTHVFAAGAAEFVASCVIPSPQPGVQGLRGGTGDVLAGDVWLIGDYGVVVRATATGIRIDAVGDVLSARRLCSPQQLFATPRFIKTITVIDDSGNRYPITPDAYGNFTFGVSDHSASDTVLRVTPQPPDALLIYAIGRSLSATV